MERHLDNFTYQPNDWQFDFWGYWVRLAWCLVPPLSELWWVNLFILGTQIWFPEILFKKLLEIYLYVNRQSSHVMLFSVYFLYKFQSPLNLIIKLVMANITTDKKHRPSPLWLRTDTRKCNTWRHTLLRETTGTNVRKAGQEVVGSNRIWLKSKDESQQHFRCPWGI